MEVKEPSEKSGQSVALPEHIRTSLKKYGTHTQMTCLECGYIGLMGVKKSTRPWYLSWWVVIVFFIISMPFGPIGWGVPIILGLAMAFSQKHTVECPNCLKELTGGRSVL